MLQLQFISYLFMFVGFGNGLPWLLYLGLAGFAASVIWLVIDIFMIPWE